MCIYATICMIYYLISRNREELSNIEESVCIFDALTMRPGYMHFAHRNSFEIRVRSNREQFCSFASVSHYLGRATIRFGKRDIYGRRYQILCGQTFNGPSHPEAVWIRILEHDSAWPN